MKKTNLSILILLCILLLASSLQSLMGQEDPEELIELAELKIIKAFKAVKTAEANGGDVTILVEKLSNALQLLDEAKYDNAIGDEASAINKASISAFVSNEVECEALNLAATSASKADYDFKLAVVFAVVASTISIYATISSWKAFKRRFKENILKAKPEVNQNEP